MAGVRSPNTIPSPTFFNRLTTPAPHETRNLLIPVFTALGAVTLFQIPAMSTAIYKNTNFSDYALKGIAFGATLGFCSLLYNRMTGENNDPADKEYVSLVKINGSISTHTSEEILPLLKSAFKDTESKGVVIKINSGGGSPVQSSLINQEIVRLKRKYNKRVIVVGEDLLASGAYYIAVAADKIFVDPNTLSGSIGVICKTYGAHELAKKIGIESRVFTAGKHKSKLDELKPLEEYDEERMRKITESMHRNFIAAVKAARQDKLKGDDEELYSGEAWTGEQALAMGLVDGLGTLSDVLENEFGVTKFKEVKSDSWLSFDFLNSTDKLMHSSYSTIMGEESRVRYSM